MSKKKSFIKVNRKINTLVALYTDVISNNQISTNLLVKYFACESCYKVLLLEYRSQKNRSISKDDLKVHFSTVKSVCKYFSYQIDDELLRKIFSATETKNKMSIKKIRDISVHSITRKVIKEVENRNQELNATMDEFLRALKNK